MQVTCTYEEQVMLSNGAVMPLEKTHDFLVSMVSPTCLSP